MIAKLISWLQEEWMIGWIGLVMTALGSAITFFRSRKSSKLELERLALEISQLRNQPATVAERREIYDRLRITIESFLKGADASYSDIGELHAVIHDATFRFPSQVVAGIHSLLQSAIQLRLTNRQMETLRLRGGPGDRSLIVESNASALSAIDLYYINMPQVFMEYLSI